MNDEQIKQNAEGYYDKLDSITIEVENEPNSIVDAYIAGAHSRDEEIGRMNTTIRLYANQIVQLRKEIEQLRNPWISVEDRLPEKARGLYELEKDEEHKKILFKTKNGTIYQGYLDAEEIWRAFTVPYRMPYPIDSLTWSKVTHWMPLPKVKKGE